MLHPSTIISDALPLLSMIKSGLHSLFGIDNIPDPISSRKYISNGKMNMLSESST